MAGGKHARRDPGYLPRPCRADAVAPPQRLQQGVREHVCAAGERRSDDGKVYRVPPSWEGRSKHFTQEFEAFAVTLMREIPVKRAGQILGESDTRMWRMLSPT